MATLTLNQPRAPRVPVWRRSLGSYDEWRRVTKKYWLAMGGDNNPDLLRTRSPYGPLYWAAQTTQHN